MPRTFTADERAAVQGQTLDCYARFEIEDPDGTRRDVTGGLRNSTDDWLNEVTISDDIDANTPSLSGSLLREIGLSTLSLAPFRSDSLVNRNGLGAYAPALDLWRKWWVSAAVVPKGFPPQSTDWRELAQGRMDEIDVQGDKSEISISGRGEEAVFIDGWISVERHYSGPAETVLQQILDDNLGTGRANVGSSGYTIYTPVSPLYVFNDFPLPVGNLWEGMSSVAEKPAFVLRFRYDASNVNRLTFFKPNRTATVEDWSLGPDEYLSISQNRIDIRDIRNVAKITYADSTAGKSVVYSPKNTGTVSCTAGAATFSTSQAGVIANGSVIFVHGVSGCFVVSAFNGTTGCTLATVGGGSPTFSASNWGTNASLTQYKKRVDIEIDLSSQTQVTNGTAAQGFADAVVSDTQFPNLEQEVLTYGFWFAQLRDYGKFLANKVHYDTDQLGGVVRIAHRMAGGTIKSTLGLRGKPAGRYNNWFLLSANGPIDQKAIALVCRAKVQSTSPTAVTFRVAVADPFPLSDISVAYAVVGTGSASPSSPQTIALASITNDIETTGFVDITVNRAAFGSGTGRITFTATSAGRIANSDAGEVPSLDRDTVFLNARARVTSQTATTLTVRVAVADPYPQGANSATITYQEQNTGAATSPASGGTVTPAATITEAAGTFIDYTITRPAFGAGAGRVTFTTTAANRGSAQDAVDIPEVARDSQTISARVLRISETADQIVVRVSAIAPNAGAIPVTATVAYDGGGLTVSPASGGTFSASSDFAFSGHIDYTITRDTQGGTPRRVAFTVSSPGYLDGTDGVDVPPTSNRNQCQVYSTSAQSLSTSGNFFPVNWNAEQYDDGALHDNAVSNTRITIPSGGDKGVYYLSALVQFQSNATGGRTVRIVKNGSTILSEVILPPVSGDFTKVMVHAYEKNPTVGDYYEVHAKQASGGALNIGSNTGTINDGFFQAQQQLGG